jgi:hypothetical protein
MRILFHDIIQESDAPASLKAPALANMFTWGGPLTITFDQTRTVDAFGIGNTDATEAVLTFDDGAATVITLDIDGNGLYPLNQSITATSVILELNGVYVGRVGLGKGILIPTAIAKQPGFVSTAEPRTTLSGQQIEGAGGYTYRTLSVDSRYKIGPEAMEEIQAGYPVIGKGFPFFISFDCEVYKLPFNKLYATERNQRNFSMEGGINKYLYSRRFEWEEKF